MAKKSNKSLGIAKRYIKQLGSKLNVREAILFGSCARGDAHRDSDLDIIVVSEDFRKMKFIQRLVLLSKARERKFMSPAMDLWGYTPEEFVKLKRDSIVVQEAAEHGVALV